MSDETKGKERPNIPGIGSYVVAWTRDPSENASKWIGSQCRDCMQTVPMDTDRVVEHMNAEALCAGGGKEVQFDLVEKIGGSWVVLSTDTGIILGKHPTRADAEKQKTEIVPIGHADDAKPSKEMRVRRFDFVSELKPPEKMDNGYLRVEGRIARVGIQEYRDGEGGIRKELRLPEEVFDPISLASFALVPVCNNHPPMLLTAQNAKQYTVGSVGHPTQDGDYVRASILIHDARAIDDAEHGRSQLSNGYSCELDETQDAELTRKYGSYDAIQRTIRGNHVALVDNARAGTEARIRLDASDAEEIEAAEVGGNDKAMLAFSSKAKADRETISMPHKFKLDGFDIAVEDTNMEAVIQRSISSSLEKAAAEKARADAAMKSLEESDKARADGQKKLSETQAKYDAFVAKLKADAARMKTCDECDGKGKIDGKMCDNCDGKGKVPFKDGDGDDDYDDESSFVTDPAGDGEKTQAAGKTGATIKKDSVAAKRQASRQRIINRAAKIRSNILVEAQRHLGINEKLDELDIMEIKKRVIAKLDKDLKLEKGVLREDGVERDDTYVNVRYDIAIKQAARNVVRPIDAARAAATETFISHSDEQPTDADEARRAMIARAVAANAKNSRSQ